MRVVICSAEQAGTVAQCAGVAAALARRLAGEGVVEVRRRRWWLDLAVRLPVVRRAYVPDLILSCARVGERQGRRLRGRCPDALWVHIETTKAAGRAPDLHVVPRHDWEPAFDAAPHMMAVAGAPHGVWPSDLAAARDAARGRRGLDPAARAAVFLIGGPNTAFGYDDPSVARLAEAVESVAARGVRCFVTLSRRSPAALAARLGRLRGPAVEVWTGAGPNPYRDYLALGDAFFVTEDSITMTCEAAATGRRVHILPLTPLPGARLDKFRRFQASYAGSLAPFWAFDGVLEPPSAAPPSAADAVAARILDLLGSGRRAAPSSAIRVSTP